MDRNRAKAIRKRMDAANTTPVYVSETVAAFCRELVPDAQPVYVPVRAAAGAEPMGCFRNVPSHVQQFGGTLVHGWTIWLWPRIVISAEFHGCWQNPETGELVDITPKREQRILFVSDPIRTFNGARVPNVYKPLHTHPVVGDWIAAQLKIGSMIVVGPQLVTQAMMQAQIRGIELTERLLKLK